MRPDKYRRRQQAPRADDRIRLRIAQEAARRLVGRLAPEGGGPLADLIEADYYAAKRKAAAVLGRRIRPGDLPSDHEVRDAVVALLRDRDASEAALAEPTADLEPDPDLEARPARLADHLDRFALYALRLEPLGLVKQGAKAHPEGDALYHSLQVFELARSERPFDEEFLLATLLHDVGKAIDPADPVLAGLESLEGAITERTRWLIAHLRDALGAIAAAPNGRARRVPGVEADPDDLDDLLLLARLDLDGRVPGVPVPNVDEALAFIKGIEDESYLGEP